MLLEKEAELGTGGGKADTHAHTHPAVALVWSAPTPQEHPCASLPPLHPPQTRLPSSTADSSSLSS